MRIFILDSIVERIPYGTCTALVEPVAHIDGGTIDKLALEVGIFHQSAEQTSVVVLVCPISTFIIVGVVKPLDGIVAGRDSIQSQSEIRVLHNPAPTPVFTARSPHHDVIAGEVAVVIVEVDKHKIKELHRVHPLVVFGKGMSVFTIELLEGIIVIPCALLQFPPVFKHVEVLKAIVVGVDIILVATLADIQHTHIFAIEIENGRAIGLEVDVAVACGVELDDGVALE